jgi:DNA excision repair protein ERCC-2
MNTLKSLMTKLKSIKLFFKSKGSSKSIYKAFSSIIEEIEKIMKIDFPYVDIDVPQGLIKFIRNFAELCDLLDQKRIKAAYPEVSSFFLQVYFDMISFLRIYEYFGPAHRFIIEQGQEDIIVSLFCLNPSEFIKACSGRVKSSIFFSATLEPICFYAPLFGLDQDTVKLKCPSPFPKENFKVIIQTSCSMKYEHRDDALPDLALTMINMVKAKKGNYLLFLPSFLYLEKIRTILEKVLKGYSVDIVSQEKEMSIDLREEFLENFTETREKSLLGLAVMGGLFSEGIDLRGSRLSGAVIAGPGLPAVTFRRELIREYFENEFKQGFEFAYIYPGMNRVLQAAGRVIRSSKDRGAVILFDKRFSRNIYKKNLPSWWHKSESASPKVISRMLDRFWLAEPE